MWYAEDEHLESVYEDREAYGLDDPYGDYGDEGGYEDLPDGDDIEPDDSGEPYEPETDQVGPDFYVTDVPSYWDRVLAGGLVVPFVSAA